MNKKTLLLVLAAFSTCAFAVNDGSRCMAHPDKAASKFSSMYGKSFTIHTSDTYKNGADGCAAALMKADSTLKVTVASDEPTGTELKVTAN